MNNISVTVPVIAVSILLSSAQASPLVVNGSFEAPFSPGSNFISFNGLTRDIDIPGWTTTSILTAIVTPKTSVPTNFNLLWQPTTLSPDGGNFSAADGSFGLGTLTQTLHLVKGQSYNLSFYQAAGQLQGNDGPTTDQWVVTIGGNLAPTTSVTLPDGTFWSPFITDVVVNEDYRWVTPLISIPSHGFSVWQPESFSFVAKSATELLGFLGIGAPLVVPPLVLLDGVSIEAVPEPETFALLGVGLLGILLAQRKCRSRTRRLPFLDRKPNRIRPQ